LKNFIEKYKNITSSGKKFTLSDWQSTGLLTKLAPEQEPQVIELFEKAMPFIIKHQGDESLVKFILPLICRTYIELVNTLSIRNYSTSIRIVGPEIQSGAHHIKNIELEIYNLINIKELLDDFIEVWPQTLKEFQRYEYIDAEVYFINLLTDNFVAKILESIKNKSPEELRAIIRQIKLEKII
jgi:hypothetical protein